MAQIDPVTVGSRRGLLDVLDALQLHLPSIIICGAQAIYLQTGNWRIRVAASTKDADIALDVRTLAGEPLVGTIMLDIGFQPDNNWPGTHRRASDQAVVDILVAESQAGRPSRRAAKLDVQGDKVATRTVGLEPVLVDNDVMAVGSLESGDPRIFEVRVAGPAAMLVAKAHKIAERDRSKRALSDKDATDVYRILDKVSVESLDTRFRLLVSIEVSRAATKVGLELFKQLFGQEDALGVEMAVRNLSGVANEEETRVSLFAEAEELIGSVGTWLDT